MQRILFPIAAILLLTSGCESKDERLAQFAAESTAQQARQNEQAARQTQQIAEASRILVEADVQARAGFSEQAGQLQQERITVGEHRDALEAERREIAVQRQREPVVAQAIGSAALLTACLLPLILCIYVLKTAFTASPEAAVIGEFLVQELTSAEPQLLLPQVTAPRLEQHARQPPDPQSTV